MFLSVFDVDHTLLRVNCSFRYYCYLLLNQKKYFSFLPKFFISYIQFSLFQLSPKELHHIVFSSFLKGKNCDDFFFHVSDFLDKSLNQFLYPPAILALNKAKEKNHHICLTSSSPEPIVGAIAKRLQVSNCYATEYGVDKEKRFSNILHMVDGKKKAKFVLELSKKLKIKKEHIFAYTDSYWDLPLLQCVANPVAVNPDKHLLRLCKQQRWNIL